VLNKYRKVFREKLFGGDCLWVLVL
jgi:hypothetical protein